MTENAPAKPGPKISEAPASPPTQSPDPSASQKPVRRGMLGEYLYFLKTYKKWWLAPVIATILILGVLVTIGGTQGALMIYALF
jgi:hypothetical protein